MGGYRHDCVSVMCPGSLGLLPIANLLHKPVGRWGYVPISQMRRPRLRDAGPPGCTLPQRVPWSGPLPPAAAHPAPAVSHGPGVGGGGEFWRKRSPKRCLNLSWAPLPASIACQGLGCLRKRGASFGMQRVGSRPWPCGHPQLWPWPRPLCPPLAGYSETRSGRGASLGGETVPEWTSEPVQTLMILLSKPLNVARNGLQGGLGGGGVGASASEGGWARGSS